MKVFDGLKKEDVPTADDVSSFCRSVKGSIAAAGLNAVDGGIVVAAVRDRAQLPTAVIVAMRTTDDCAYAQGLL